MEKSKKVAVIGGGAAGFFAAISVANHHPDAQITLYEKSVKVLTKVKISGGGRCNVTHDCNDISELVKAYPRGGRALKTLFHQFNVTDTRQWFELRGVALKTEADGRVFPLSDNSQSIVNCLEKEIDQRGIKLKVKSEIKKLIPKEGKWELHLGHGESVAHDTVIVTTGGSPKRKGFDWLEAIGHDIVAPVPSLFTFNMPNEAITQLMGVVAKEVRLTLVGTKIKTTGPVLITHWGMSGPAILKASSMAARLLEHNNYHFQLRLQWTNHTAEELYQHFSVTAKAQSQKLLFNHNPLDIPQRLWHFLLQKSSLSKERRWNEIGKKNWRRLAELIANDHYEVNGKTTFKEEFVTCGGVALSNINLKTMESKKAKGLYFAGEVLDIDAITGGYNFQAAWSGGFVAGQLL